MHVIEANNVRDALPKAAAYLLDHGKEEPTREGPALVAPGPVTIHYRNPKQHVLLNPIRDANPFFHLMESIWMLAGRDDSKFLDHYIKDFSKRYGQHGTVMDAYGHRWRKGLRGTDQLDEIVAQLRRDPTTRQCVLQMWGAGRIDLIANSSKPCNLVATFRIQGVKLHMTVFNRSNDLIWGCCGANAVHFPILQEYLAGKIGIEMGEYWQISTNLHLYQHHIDMLRAKLVGENDAANIVQYLEDETPYGLTQALIPDPKQFDEDIGDTMLYIDMIHLNQEGYDGDISNPFLRETVLPMAVAHNDFKNKNITAALETIVQVRAADWRTAGHQWLERRIK
jgi:thymidylate synthase